MAQSLERTKYFHNRSHGYSNSQGTPGEGMQIWTMSESRAQDATRPGLTLSRGARKLRGAGSEVKGLAL